MLDPSFTAIYAALAFSKRLVAGQAVPPVDPATIEFSSGARHNLKRSALLATGQLPWVGQVRCRPFLQFLARAARADCSSS